MQATKRKREVSSCLPCYTRKQKCDRQYPCNRCTKRRRPELCAYTSSSSSSSSSSTSAQPQMPSLPGLAENGHHEDAGQIGANQWGYDDAVEAAQSSPTFTSRSTTSKQLESTSLADIFGYYGDSKCNTMALVRKVSPLFFTSSVGLLMAWRSADGPRRRHPRRQGHPHIKRDRRPSPQETG